MKIIQHAKWAPGGTVGDPGARWGDMTNDGVNGASQPAIIEIDDLRLYSGKPMTAAEAMKINARIDIWYRADVPEQVVL